MNQVHFLTKNFGKYDTSSIGSYMNVGGFEALRRVAVQRPQQPGFEPGRDVGPIAAGRCRLAEAGVREITLLGQNVNGWHGEGQCFGERVNHGCILERDKAPGQPHSKSVA